MSATIQIRPFAAADHDVWLPLWRGYQTFYKVDIPAATSEVTWSRILDPSEPMFGALAFANGVAVGMVQWLFHRTTWTVGNNCYLQDLFVANNTRGGGVGRKLIEHVYDAARAAGCPRVYWMTHETNAEAMVLYNSIADRSGFLQYRKNLG